MTLISLIILALLGWLTGAGINLLSDQLPMDRKLGRPACPECHEPMNMLQFIFLEACDHCGGDRSARSFIAQWLITIAFVTVSFWKPERIMTIEALLLVTYFGLVLIIDIEHRLILHPVSLAGAVLGFLIGVRLHGAGLTIIGGYRRLRHDAAFIFPGRVIRKSNGETAWGAD